MHCPGCHASIADDSKYCQYCGVPIGHVAAPRTSGGAGPSAADALSAAAAKGSPIDPASEKPVTQFRPAWRAYVGSWVIWFAGSVVFFVLLGRFDAEGEWTLRKVALWLSAAGAAVVFVRQAWAVYSIRYRLTTQRMFVERGILTRTTDQMELVRVDDVRTKQSVVDRLLGTGSIEIVSTDATDKNCVVSGIDEPERIAEEIRKHTRTVRGRQTLFVESI